jgi:hypothetical protein
MDKTQSFTTVALIPLMGAILMSCAPMQKYDYEVISSTAVKGVPLEMVRRTALSEDGQPASGLASDYGILDPSNTFHRCVGAQCSDAEFEQAAARYEAETQEREGGDGGGGGGGGGGGM